MTTTTPHKLGDVIAGHNFVTFTCPGCNTTTLLTPAGGSLRECRPDCPEPNHPNYHVQQFLLQGADCELVGEHKWHDICPQAFNWDPKLPEDAEPDGNWEKS